jgi:hypothetical protein
MTSRSFPWAVAAVTAGLLASLPVALPASDPMGVYAVVQKVVLEPNEAEPLRIQVWGAFAVSDGKRDSDAYTAPQVGYLYYSCPSGQERTCRNEWSDLKTVAGKGVGVGFGGRYLAAGRVRKASEAPASPDPYPIKMGVTRMTSLHEQPAIIAQLKAALPAR